MDELKRCPCCNGSANCNNMGLVDHDGTPLWWVVCLACKLSTHGHKTKKEAIAAWNRRASGWIPVTERLPEPEIEVLILAEISNGKKIKTTAMYEDGKIKADESAWCWQDINFDRDDETGEDLIPYGWWEYNHYNQSDYNHAIDDRVTHWQPLPAGPEKGE